MDFFATLVAEDDADFGDSGFFNILDHVFEDWFVCDWDDLFRPGVGDWAEARARSVRK